MQLGKGRTADVLQLSRETEGLKPQLLSGMLGRTVQIRTRSEALKSPAKKEKGCVMNMKGRMCVTINLALDCLRRAKDEMEAEDSDDAITAYLDRQILLAWNYMATARSLANLINSGLVGPEDETRCESSRQQTNTSSVFYDGRQSG